MLRHLTMLGAAAIAVVLIAAPADAVIDFTPGVAGEGGTVSVISTDIRNIAVPEPATMMLLGMGLLAAFRDRRQRQA